MSSASRSDSMLTSNNKGLGASTARSPTTGSPDAARNGSRLPRPHQARNGNGGRPPKIPLTPMYERTDARGARYLVGRIGLLKPLVVSTGEVSGGNPVWQAFVAQGPYATAEQAALAQALEETQP